MSYTAFLILILIVAIALILIVMVQNPKGGGLSSSFGGGGSAQMGGVQKTTDFLDKSTWTLGGLLLVLILLSSIPLVGSIETEQSTIQDTDLIQTTAPATPDAGTTEPQD
jgi:preprotein translocase subunit SecG